MKVLYAITRAERGGAQTHVAGLLAGLRDRHDLHLAVGEEGYLCEIARRLRIPLHIVSRLRRSVHPVHDPLAIASFAALIRRLKPDLVHAHTSKAGLVARLAALITGTPAVYTVHSWGFAEGMPKWQKVVSLPIERLCAPLSAKFILVSEAARLAALRAGIGKPEQMQTIWNGVPDDAFRANPGRGFPIRLAMVARFAPPKDQALLLTALSELSGDFQAIFVGSGPALDETRKLSARLRLSFKTLFLGDRDDVASILSEAHIAVLATTGEGLPLAVLEAMRAGLPVIASDAGGVREAVQDGKTGLLVPPRDATALRFAIERLLSDASLRIAMGRDGRLRYERYFSIEQMLSRTEDVYQEVMGFAHFYSEAIGDDRDPTDASAAGTKRLPSRSIRETLR